MTLTTWFGAGCAASLTFWQASTASETAAYQVVWPLLLGADTRITQPLTIVISKKRCSQSAANSFSQRVFNGLVPKALLNPAARFEFLWDDARSEGRAKGVGQRDGRQSGCDRLGGDTPLDYLLNLMRN